MSYAFYMWHDSSMTGNHFHLLLSPSFSLSFFLLLFFTYTFSLSLPLSDIKHDRQPFPSLSYFFSLPLSPPPPSLTCDMIGNNFLLSLSFILPLSLSLSPSLSYSLSLSPSLWHKTTRQATISFCPAHGFPTVRGKKDLLTPMKSLMAQSRAPLNQNQNLYMIFRNLGGECARVCERERERVCVCVCVRESSYCRRGLESVLDLSDSRRWVCACVWTRERVCVCVCVCVRESSYYRWGPESVLDLLESRRWVCVCVWKRESVCVCVCVCQRVHLL